MMKRPLRMLTALSLAAACNGRTGGPDGSVDRPPDAYDAGGSGGRIDGGRPDLPSFDGGVDLPAFDAGTGDTIGGRGPVPNDGGATDVLVPPPVATGVSQFSALPQLDVLFMVDNSPGMEPLQSKVGQGFAAIMAALRGLPRVPSLHVGVVTSDLGSGVVTSGIPGCSKQPFGDQGVLQHTPGYAHTWDSTQGRWTSTQKTCTPPSGSFIQTAEGEQSPNFSGTIENVFECIAPVGARGCGFEAQMGSVLRALDADPWYPMPVENAGFLRKDAHLAVVLLTNEDDCSVPPDSILFDPSSRNLAGEYGPLASYRCNAFGHVCDGDWVPMLPGDATFPFQPAECHSAEDGTLLTVGSTARELRALKTRPEMVQLTVVGGPKAPYSVSLDSTLPAAWGYANEQWPRVDHSCGSDSGPSPTYADPPVRLTELSTALGKHGRFVAGACAESLGTAMQEAAADIAAHAVLHCADGIQATSTQCVAELTRDGGAPSAIPECAPAGASGGPAPCWYRKPSALCESGTELVLNDSQPLSASTVVKITCQ